MSLVNQNNPAFWTDGTPRSMYTGFTRGLSDDCSEALDALQPSPKARTNPGKPSSEKRPIEQLTLAGKLIRVYESASEAARATGLSNPNIVRVAGGRRNSAGGFRWRYANPAAQEILRDRHCGAYSKAKTK